MRTMTGFFFLLGWQKYPLSILAVSVRRKSNCGWMLLFVVNNDPFRMQIHKTQVFGPMI